MNRIAAMKIQPFSGRQRRRAGGERKGQDHHHEHRAPADLVTEPAEENPTRYRRHPRGEQDRPRLPERQMPILYEKRQDKTNQGKIKEVNNDGKQTGCKNFSLIYGQRILLLEKIQHDTPPVRFVGPLAALGRAGHGLVY
jgi:hypothetical protein